MPSLSKIVNKQKRGETKEPLTLENSFSKVKLDELDISPVPLRRETTSTTLTIPRLDNVKEPEPEPEEMEHLLFVSDHKLIPSIKEQLQDYKNIYKYDRDLFTNRTCADLLAKECHHLWVCLQDKYARAWLGKALLNNDIYTVVVAYKGDKNQKWINDLKDVSDIVCKVSELGNIKSLTYGDMLNGLESLEIHEPVSKLLSCLGISKNISKKKS